uniref:Mediator of RNA polymerase II transcription subunit 28 n=1 Tax=Ciona savignyi TaxID=51511 RepID=H2YVN9_CIOSA
MIINRYIINIYFGHFLMDRSTSSVIDDLESSFRSCISHLVADEPSIGVTHQDEQKSTIEFAIQEFLKCARQTEAYFLKERASLAMKQPEFVLQEDIEELEAELQRKDETIRNHLDKLHQWKTTLNQM